MMRILLVEDDVMIGEALSLALTDASYAVTWAQDGERAATVLKDGAYDAVLLDLSLPKRDGFDVLRHLRQWGHTVPVIVITARSEITDRITGLDSGADDYVMKPFDVRELLARLRAVIRRKSDRTAPVVLTNGDLALDPITRKARFREATETLSGREFSLLQALLSQPGTVLSRSELEACVYERNQQVESNAIDFLIHGIRKKLGMGAIKNVRGVGWKVEKIQ